MILDKATDLRAALGAGERLMGLDLGSKTIGLALSDPALRLATPLATLRRQKFTKDAEALSAEIDTWKVGGLVLGLPVNMDGSEGPRCQSTRAFARNLLQKRDLPLLFWDERLSTAAVERFLIDEVDASRRRREQVVDKLAAQWILQGVLDALARSRPALD